MPRAVSGEASARKTLPRLGAESQLELPSARPRRQSIVARPKDHPAALPHHASLKKIQEQMLPETAPGAWAGAPDPADRTQCGVADTGWSSTVAAFRPQQSAAGWLARAWRGRQHRRTAPNVARPCRWRSALLIVR